MRRRLRVVQTHRAEKIALDRARSGAPISPQCNRAPKPLNRAHRRRGTLAKSQCKPNFRRLVPTRMASIAGGTRVGRVCSVAFGLIARRVGRVTRIAMVGCASGRTRTIERDTKGAKTRFIAPAYGKFESSSLQRGVCEPSVPCRASNFRLGSPATRWAFSLVPYSRRAPCGRGRHLRWCCSLEERGSELNAMRAVVDPAPAGLDELAGRNHRRVAEDGDQIALTTRLYPQYAEPVFLIVERDALYQAS